MRGCKLYGTGGGGSTDYGVRMMLDTLKRGREIKTRFPQSLMVPGPSVHRTGSIAERTPSGLDGQSGEPITNPESKEGESVSTYGIKADRRFRSKMDSKYSARVTSATISRTGQ